MKKLCFLVSLLVLTPILASAAHVLIWEYDSVDVFYDAQLGRTVDCPYWLQQTLTANGHTYATTNTLPTNLDPYNVVFVTLGWFRC